jgi:hypothetical protein
VNEIHWEYFTPAVNWRISNSPPVASPNINISFW